MPPSTASSTRPEFDTLPPRVTAFARLSLQRFSSITATGFPDGLIAQLESAIKGFWAFGVKEQKANLQVGSWSMTLHGQPWKKAGHEELESIQLILIIFKTLGRAGWQLKSNLNPTTSGNVQDFVFEYTGAIQSGFFAITCPLPYYVSIVSPPLEQCPAIISAVRKSLGAPVPARSPALQAAMAASSAFGQRSSVPNSPTSPSRKTLSLPTAISHDSSVSPPSSQGKLSIKSEAWVTSSVFCFTIAGFRGFRGIKWDLYDVAYPHILLAILHNLDAEYFAPVSHVALTPTQRGRDLIIFSSIGPRTVEDRTPSSINLAEDALSLSIPPPPSPFEPRPQPATRLSPHKAPNTPLDEEAPRAISPPPSSKSSPSKRSHFMRRRHKNGKDSEPTRKSDQSWVVLSDDETHEAKERTAIISMPPLPPRHDSRPENQTSGGDRSIDSDDVPLAALRARRPDTMFTSTFIPDELADFADLHERAETPREGVGFATGTKGLQKDALKGDDDVSVNSFATANEAAAPQAPVIYPPYPPPPVDASGIILPPPDLPSVPALPPRPPLPFELPRSPPPSPRRKPASPSKRRFSQTRHAPSKSVDYPAGSSRTAVLSPKLLPSTKRTDSEETVKGPSQPETAKSDYHPHKTDDKRGKGGKFVEIFRESRLAPMSWVGDPVKTRIEPGRDVGLTVQKGSA